MDRLSVLTAGQDNTPFIHFADAGESLMEFFVYKV